MKIIAFGHKKGTGKDTAGKFLDTILRANNINSCRASFADKLKDVAFQLYAWAGLKRGIYYETHYNEKEGVLPEIGLSPREIWINIGNKLREVYPDTWLDFVLKGVNCDVVIVTDLRFWNEAMKLREQDAVLVRMLRDGISAGDDPAETSLNDWDDWNYEVDNNGDLATLNNHIILLAKKEGLLCG